MKFETILRILLAQPSNPKPVSMPISMVDFVATFFKSEASEERFKLIV
jgi:hypothetical protein